MDATYNELTSAIDAREILRYLNQLGIHNISGEVLKHFISDLKKLIKYELKQKAEESDEHFTKTVGPERLHSATTFSSRIRSKVHSGTLNCSRDCEKRKLLTVRNIRSAPELRMKKTEEKPLRRACSCVKVEKKIDMQVKESTTSLSNNLIKVAKPVTLKKSDPVNLYHYYSSLWEKYKSNVPGENNWADLRWSVRQKMAGNMPVQSQKVALKK